LTALNTPEGKADPYPLYAALHELGEAADLGPGGVLVYGYEALSTVLRDPAFRHPGAAGFDVGIPGWREHPSLSQGAEWILYASAPEHARIRNLMARVFTARRVAGLEPAIAAMTDEHAVRPAGQPAVPALAADLHHGPLAGVLGVGARERSGVDREHQRLARPGQGRPGDQQMPQPVTADPALGQGVAGGAVSAAELRLHGQLHRRSHRSLRAQHRVRQLEQRSPAPGKTGKETNAEPG
jgi:cytochrome P450